MSYKLFRNLHDIINPTISRKNISNYDIELDVNMAPLKVFYPEIGVENKKIIVFIPGKINNNKFYSVLAERTENIVIVIKSNKKDECYNIISYLYNNVEKENLNKDDLTLMTDTNSSELCETIIHDGIIKRVFSINKVVLLLPTKINNEDKNRLVILEDKEDTEQNDKYQYVKYLDEVFFNEYDYATCEHIYSLVNEFLSK